MYYNVDIARKAGLLDASGKLKPLNGPTAVLNAFKAAQKVTGKYGLSMASADAVQPWRLFYTLYSQLGGKLVVGRRQDRTTRYGESHHGRPIHGRVDPAQISPANAAYADSVALFGSGKAGFMWNGEWEVTTYQAEKMAFDMTLFPTVFGSSATWSDSHSFVVPHQRSMSADRLAAILTFISFLLEGQPHLGQGRPYPGVSADRPPAPPIRAWCPTRIMRPKQACHL